MNASIWDTQGKITTYPGARSTAYIYSDYCDETSANIKRTPGGNIDLTEIGKRNRTKKISSPSSEKHDPIDMECYEYLFYRKDT